MTSVHTSVNYFTLNEKAYYAHVVTVIAEQHILFQIFFSKHFISPLHNTIKWKRFVFPEKTLNYCATNIYMLTQPHSIQHSTLLSFLYVYKEAVLKSILVYNFKSLFRWEYWMEKHCTTAEIFWSISQVSHTISTTRNNTKKSLLLFFIWITSFSVFVRV